MPGEPITVREVRDGDETAILDLFARSFPHAHRGLEHYEWKYGHNPSGNHHISLAFDHENRLVGHYAGYVVPFHALGKDLVAHQIGDTMTDVPVRHLGRGPTSVLGRTALDFYARFCEGRVAFNFGFNVANIQKFSLRFLRSDRVEPVPWRSRDLLVHPLAPLDRFEKWVTGCRFERARTAGPDFDDLFLQVAPAYRFLVKRDAAYVRWRYLECPDRDYTVVALRKWRRLIGWIAYRVEGDRFLWGDALFHPDYPEAVEMMLRQVAGPLSVTRIEGWFPPRPAWFGKLLDALHFPVGTEPQSLSLMCVPFGWPGVVEAMRSDLYYTWGDGDLF